ncbi:exodeoxyribonuclease V subunit gamma [Myxococcota bacterium]|nr:exodeoxyribonuclease V subunit gamma [Myxococcota bacterium]
MALHVIESNQVRVLLAALDERLGAFDLFETRSVLVPGRHFFSVVKNALAGARGACFQVEIQTFDAWLSRRLRTHRPGVWPADTDSLVAACFQELAFSDLTGDPAFADLRAYLLQGTGELQTDVVWQVAVQLGDLFRRYHLERPQLTMAWSEGRTLTESPVERWQAHLFTRIFESARALGEFGFPVDDLMAHTRPAELAPELHVLVPHPWPLRDRTLLHWMSSEIEVHLYLFSPCREFFEQVRRVHRASGEEGEGLTGNHPLLDAWGGPLAEPVAFCHELSGYQTHTLYEDPGEATNLARVKGSILDNREGVTLTVPDDSLRVWSFPSRREECVAIRDDLMARLKGDPRLRLCDFAVVVPEADSGPSALDELISVFSEDPALPLHRVRWRSDSESRILQTVGQLLELPPGEGRAAAVLELVCSPALAAWTPEEEQLIRHWIGVTGVIRGWRDADLQQQDPALKTHSWEHALWRLSLGAVTAPGGALQLEVPGAGPLGVRPLDFSADQWPLLARLLTIVHGLRQFCEACATRRTMAGWMEFLGTELADLLTPRTERDEKLMGHCREVLSAHARLPLWRLRDPHLAYREVLPIVTAGIENLRTGHSPWGERNVWVGPIADLQLLPFAHVYFAGLEDGIVAREIPASPLDARSAEGMPGREPTPRETELGRFLTALCHADESVTFSWCDRNAVTGDPVARATVIRELIEAVDPGGQVLMQAPTAPVVLRSSRVAAAAERLAKAGFDPAALPESAPEALRAFLKVPPPLQPLEPRGGIRRLYWKDFSRFVEFPLQVTASTWFHAARHESGELPEHELDTLGSRERNAWLDQVVARELAAGTDPYDPGLDGRLARDAAEFLETAAAQAWGPAGVFSLAKCGPLADDLCDTVRCTLTAVASVLPDRADWKGFWRACPGMDPSLEPGASPPVRLASAGAGVSGRLPWYHVSRGLLLVLDYVKKGDTPVARVCDAWVALQLYRVIAPEAALDTVRILLVRPFAKKAQQQLSWEWPVPDPAQALEYLEQLAGAIPDPENLAFFTADLAMEWLSGDFRDFDSWYGKRAPSLLHAWENSDFDTFRLEPIWNLGPLIDASRARALAQRLFLDPQAPVAWQFQNRIRPVVTGVFPDAQPAGAGQEGSDGEA